jgi:hypothetical protein
LPTVASSAAGSYRPDVKLPLLTISTYLIQSMLTSPRGHKCTRTICRPSCTPLVIEPFFHTRRQGSLPPSVADTIQALPAEHCDQTHDHHRCSAEPLDACCKRHKLGIVCAASMDAAFMTVHKHPGTILLEETRKLHTAQHSTCQTWLVGQICPSDHGQWHAHSKG